MLKFTDDTSTLPLEELMRLWWRGDLTETQRWPFRRGHLLQHIAHIDKRVLRLEHPSAQPLTDLPTSDQSRPAPRPARKRSRK